MYNTLIKQFEIQVCLFNIKKSLDFYNIYFNLIFEFRSYNKFNDRLNIIRIIRKIIFKIN